MIVLDMDQDSPEWVQARLGVPTASCFGKIITPTGKRVASKTGDDYRRELLDEWAQGQPGESVQSDFMERGKLLEGNGIREYEFHKDVDVQRVGFCLLDDRSAGCSPDGLVGEQGGVEVKTPTRVTHLSYLLAGAIPSIYWPQVQGSLYITGRDWWDWVSYNPDYPAAIVRAERDEPYIATLAEYLADFLGTLEIERAMLLEMGVEPVKPI